MRLIPNLRAAVACELCRLGGFGHLWNPGQESPRDEFTIYMARRNRPRILVLAQRVWQGRGDLSIEDLIEGLNTKELAAVCELLQSIKGGAAMIEDWIRRWHEAPAPQGFRYIEDEPADDPSPEDPPPTKPQGEFRLESPVQHRRSR